MLDGDLPDVVATTVTTLHEAGHLKPTDRLHHRLGRVGFRRFHLIQFSISAPEPVSSVRPPPAAAGGGRNRQGCVSLLVVLAVGESRSAAPARRALARRTKALRAGCHGAYQLLDLMHQGPLLSSSLNRLIPVSNVRSTCITLLTSAIPSSKLVCPVLDLDCSFHVSRF